MSWALAIENMRLRKKIKELENKLYINVIEKDHFTCNYCGTKTNLDMPGLCRSEICQRKARIKNN